MTRALYHYTCDCRRNIIGTTGHILPVELQAPDRVEQLPEEWRWITELCWFTDQTTPDPIALGLTRTTIDCDRTQWRYQALALDGIMPWRVAAKDLPRNAWKLTQGDAQPGHWWVARGPVPVILDATWARARART